MRWRPSRQLAHERFERRLVLSADFSRRSAGVVRRMTWQGQEVDIFQDRWVVRHEAAAGGLRSLADLLVADGRWGWSAVDLGGGFHTLATPCVGVEQVIVWAARPAGVSGLEPDFTLTRSLLPNAPSLSQLLGLSNTGNGSVDDVSGWDFVSNDNVPQDGDGHGTHVAGTIGAVGNDGSGVAGVNCQVSFLPLQFLADSGTGSTSAAIAAITYATALRNRGVNIVATNNSWGGGGFASSLRDAIRAPGQAGILFVAAAGVATNAADDAAIATDKRPLRPGQTASFVNYMSYVRGITGVMVDIAGLAGTPTMADFGFRPQAAGTGTAWVAGPAPQSLALRPGAGVNGSTRVTFTRPEGAIRNAWLEVTVRPTAATGLPAADVFAFGNAIGEVGNSTRDAQVSSQDVALIGANQTATATVVDRYDVNPDGRVDFLDRAAASVNRTTSRSALQLIALAGATEAAGVQAAPADLFRLVAGPTETRRSVR